MFNILRPRQNGCRFADDTFKRIFLNKNILISIKISLKFVSKGTFTKFFSIGSDNGDNPLSELMMISLLMHICYTRAQWVNHDTILVISHGVYNSHKRQHFIGFPQLGNIPKADFKDHVCQQGLPSIPVWISNTYPVKCVMKLLIHS